MATGFDLSPMTLALKEPGSGNADGRALTLSTPVGRPYSRRRRQYEECRFERCNRRTTRSPRCISKRSSIRKLMIRDAAGRIRPVPRRIKARIEGRRPHSEPRFRHPASQSEIPSSPRWIAHERYKAIFRLGIFATEEAASPPRTNRTASCLNSRVYCPRRLIPQLPGLPNMVTSVASTAKNKA